MEINGKTKVYGLLGNPVEHTLSPKIHNTLAEHLQENMVYLPFGVKENLKDALAGAYALGICGMNVTVPYKSEVMQYLAGRDEQADKIGAVNTLVRTENGYYGYNTDLPGLYRAMKSDGVEVKGAKVIILGAGGAARAAAFLCAFYGAFQVYIVNRTKEKAAAVAEEVKAKTGFLKMLPLALEEYKKIEGNGYLVIQATKVGLFPNTEEAVIEEEDFFKKAAVVYDLIYTPEETKFMRLARQQGIQAYNGLKMLLYQGIAAYELWNEATVLPQAVARAEEALRAALQKGKGKNLILIGFMGCGKTSVGKRLAAKLGYSFLDTDELIEAEQKRTIAEIFAQEGENAFRCMETECLQKLMKRNTENYVLSVGGGLPLREENRRLLAQLGEVIYLKVSPETVYRRLRNDKTRPLLQGVNPRGRIQDLMNARQRFYEAAAHKVFEADNKEFEDILREILQACGGAK